MSRLADHERILLKLGPLEVRVQTPDRNNMASHQGAEQVAVTKPDGTVRAFFGPVDDPESFSDARLFASAPTLYEAVTLAQMALEEHDDDELREDALKLIIFALERCHPREQLN